MASAHQALEERYSRAFHRRLCGRRHVLSRVAGLRRDKQHADIFFRISPPLNRRLFGKTLTPTPPRLMCLTADGDENEGDRVGRRIYKSPSDLSYTARKKVLGDFVFSHFAPALRRRHRPAQGRF